MEVLGQTGPDAREQVRSDPAALVESTLETFASALERGDAETAEGAIATAIEDGIAATTLHAEVIGPWSTRRTTRQTRRQRRQLRQRPRPTPRRRARLERSWTDRRETRQYGRYRSPLREHSAMFERARRSSGPAPIAHAAQGMPRARPTCWSG